MYQNIDIQRKSATAMVNGHENESSIRKQYKNLTPTTTRTKEVLAKEIKNMNKEEARQYIMEEIRKQNSLHQRYNNTVSNEKGMAKEKSDKNEIKKRGQSVSAMSKRYEVSGNNISKQGHPVINPNQNHHLKRNSFSKDTKIAAKNGNLHSRSQSVGIRKQDNSLQQNPSNTNVLAEKEKLSPQIKPKTTDYVMGYKIKKTYPSILSTDNATKQSNSMAVVSQNDNKLKNNVLVKTVGSCILPKQKSTNFDLHDSYQPNPPKRSISVSQTACNSENITQPPTALPTFQKPATTYHKKTYSYSFVESNKPKIIPDIFEQPQIFHELNLTKPQPPQHQHQKQQQFDFLNSRKSINILILGETGVGKSTWINAFVNYLSYSSLEEAMAVGSPTLIIPTQFSLFDKNYQQHQIRLGGQDQIFEDESESVTKNAKVYLIQHGKYDIHIVDTPGINDTHGHDDQNIQDILKTIAPFKELHAICFLFKANECRLSQAFRNNISKLLSNLSKSALANACIMFTNARGTFFKPGDTMVLLKTYFKELHEREGISISISDNNTFCLDNEAFRYLCAHFSGIQFGEMETKTVSESWIRSSIEIIRLLNYAASLRPHDTSETLSINETRKWILQLVNPIIKILDFIQTNLHKLKESVENLERTKTNNEQLQKRAIIPEYSLQIIRLRHPQTVCYNEKCVQHENIGGKIQRINKKICHDKCRIPYGYTESIPDPSIKKCKKLRDDRCKICDCSWVDHRRIFFYERYVANPIPVLITQFDKQNDAIKVNQELLQKAKQIIDGYSDELNTILNAMATFSFFLYQNGIGQKSDIFEAHLRQLIETEQKMIQAVPDCDEKSYHQLTSFLKKYQKIRQNIFKSSINFSLSNMQILRQKILTLPLTGSKISQMFDIHVEADIQDHEFEMTRFRKPSNEEENVTAV